MRADGKGAAAVRLFGKELRRVFRSLTYWLAVAVLALFLFSQEVLPFDAERHLLSAPQPGQAGYGTKAVENPAQIMPAAIRSLLAEYRDNLYTAYPIGLLRQVRLPDDRQAQMADLLAQLTGAPAEALPADGGAEQGGVTIENGAAMQPDGTGGYVVNLPESQPASGPDDSSLRPREGLTYEAFLTLMQQADRLIGGGSKYSEAYLVSNFGQTPLTYEQALAIYQAIREQDRFTGAYARLFSDYAGILLSLLPVFVSTAVWLRDRRAKAEPLLYVRSVSSVRLVAARYGAVAAAMLLPTLALALFATAPTWSFYPGEPAAPLAFLAYCLGWLLPSILMAAATGLFWTVLTNTPIALLLQGLWWFADVNLGVSGNRGGYGLWQLIPRHNTLGYTQFFWDHLGELAVNRLLFTGLAALLVLLTAAVYERKRRGALHDNKQGRSLGAARTGQPAA